MVGGGVVEGVVVCGGVVERCVDVASSMIAPESVMIVGDCCVLMSLFLLLLIAVRTLLLLLEAVDVVDVLLLLRCTLLLAFCNVVIVNIDTRCNMNVLSLLAHRGRNSTKVLSVIAAVRITCRKTHTVRATLLDKRYICDIHVLITPY